MPDLLRPKIGTHVFHQKWRNLSVWYRNQFRYQTTLALQLTRLRHNAPGVDYAFASIFDAVCAILGIRKKCV